MIRASLLSFTLLLLCLTTHAQPQDPELVLPVGHTGRIADMAVSKDGRYAVTGGVDQTVVLWDLQTGFVIKKFSGFPYAINAVALSPDLKYAAVGTQAGFTLNEKSAHLLNVQSGEIEHTFTGLPYETTNVTFSPDGKRLALGSQEYLFQYDVASKRLVKKFEAGKNSFFSTVFVEGIEYLPGGSRVVTNYKKGAAIWDANTGKRLSRLKYNKNYVNDLATSSDGRYLATADVYFNLTIWDLRSQQVLRSLRSNGSYFGSIVFSPDNRLMAYVLFSTRGTAIEVIEVRTGRKLFSKQGTFAGFSGVSFLKNGTEIVTVGASSSGNSEVRKFDLASGTETTNFKINLSADEWMTIETMEKEPAFLTGGSDGSFVKWDYKKAQPVFVKKTVGSMISDFEIDTKRNQIYTAFNDGLIYTYDATTGKDLGGFPSFRSKATYPGLSNDERFAGPARGGVSTYSPYAVFSMAINPQSNYLFTGGYTGEVAYVELGGNYQKRVVQSGNPSVSRVTGKTKWYNGGNITSIDVHPNGKSYAYSKLHQQNIQRSNAAIYVVHNGTTNTIRKKTGVVRFSPDGSTLYIANRQSIYAYDMNSQRLSDPLVTTNDQIIDFDITDDGQTMAIVGRGEQLLTFDLASKRVGLNVPAHTANITGVRYSADENYLFTSSRDYTNRMWDAKTGRELAAFYSFAEDEWLVSIPEGYYYGTKSAARKLQYTLGLDVYSFDQFDLRYNRPDKVLASIGLADPLLIDSYKNAYLKRLEKMGIEQAEREQLLAGNYGSTLEAPKIEFASSFKRAFSTPNKSLSLSFSVSNVPVDRFNRIHLSINGVPVSKYRTATNGRDYKLEDITLSDGVNNIELYVTTKDGVSSLAEQLEVTYTGRKTRPTLHIVSIGVSNYRDSQWNLDLAAKDARDLIALYKNSGSFDNVETHLLTDRQVSANNVMALKKKLKATDVNDMVILFYAGHGLLDDKLDYYLATYNVDFSNPSRNGLSYRDFESLLEEIPARKKLLLLDACHSGEVDKSDAYLASGQQSQLDNQSNVSYRGFKLVKSKSKSLGLANSFELMKELFNDLRSGSGAVVISSASGGEFAFESPEWNNGVFTYSVINGLKSGQADLDKNRQVTADELQEYVSQKVSELTNGRQNPTTRKVNIKHNFAVWK